MKVIPFPLNDKDFIVNYHKTREGPNGFLCYYKHASMFKIDPLEAWRTLGIARFTDSGKALKQWCLDIHKQHCGETLEEDNTQDKFFDVPNDHTKMIT